MLHRGLGYVVAVGILVAGLNARSLVRSGRAFAPGPLVWAAVLLDVQVFLGGIQYLTARTWEVADEPMLVWAHPAMALAAVVAGHVTLRRARNERMAADAYKVAGNGFLLTAVLIALSGAAVLATT